MATFCKYKDYWIGKSGTYTSRWERDLTQEEINKCVEFANKYYKRQENPKRCGLKRLGGDFGILLSTVDLNVSISATDVMQIMNKTIFADTKVKTTWNYRIERTEECEQILRKMYFDIDNASNVIKKEIDSQRPPKTKVELLREDLYQTFQSLNSAIAQIEHDQWIDISAVGPQIDRIEENVKCMRNALLKYEKDGDI